MITAIFVIVEVFILLKNSLYYYISLHSSSLVFHLSRVFSVSFHKINFVFVATNFLENLL